MDKHYKNDINIYYFFCELNQLFIFKVEELTCQLEELRSGKLNYNYPPQVILNFFLFSTFLHFVNLSSFNIKELLYLSGMAIRPKNRRIRIPDSSANFLQFGFGSRIPDPGFRIPILIT